MTRAWQLPISGMHAAYRLHWFEVSESTAVLVRAACGRKFNPGFAERRGSLPRCSTCARAAGRVAS